MIYSRTEYLENGGTLKGYYDQFDTAKNLKCGEVYVQHKGTWQECKWKVVHLGDGIALCTQIEVLSVGEPCLFYTTGNMAGWKYRDVRPNYRLQELDLC